MISSKNIFIGTVIMNILSVLTSGFIAHTIRTTRPQPLPATSQFEVISNVKAAMLFQVVVLVTYMAPLIYGFVNFVKLIQNRKYEYSVDIFNTWYILIPIALMVVGFLSIAVDMFGNCSTILISHETN